MKILGLQFEIKNGENILYCLCDKLKIKDYCLKIENANIHYSINGDYKVLSLPDVLCGEDFLNKLKDKDYYLTSIEIKAFLKHHEIKEIISYTEFIDSYCQIVILNYDCNYFRVYFKNKEDLNTIHKWLLKKDQVINLSYLTNSESHFKLTIF